MSVIIIALQKKETAAKIKSVLVSHGFSHVVYAPTGASALVEMGKDNCGVVICGWKLSDMYYMELQRCLPKYFELILVAKADLIRSDSSGTLALETPLKVSDLISTVSMIMSQLGRRLKKDRHKPKVRTWQEENYIRNAKFLLMERNHLSEEDAHRYIQKSSMDNGTNMVETAQMILTLMYEEV